MASDGAETMSAGRSFQIHGATMPKTRSLIAYAYIQDIQYQKLHN